MRRLGDFQRHSEDSSCPCHRCRAFALAFVLARVDPVEDDFNFEQLYHGATAFSIAVAWRAWLQLRQAAGLACLCLVFLTGCASAPPNRLAHYPEADVLFTSYAEVDRLCHTMRNAVPNATYRGCYFPALKLAIVPHGDTHNLAHELRHAREGAWHD